MNSQEDEPVRKKGKGIRAPVVGVVASVALLFGIFGYAWWGKLHETERADTATGAAQNQQADAKTLAQGIQKACAAKVPEVTQYCERAKEVIAQPSIPGPKGDTGAQGVPGPQGSPGLAGRPGVPGASGKPGANGSPGPAGADGSPGPAGADGSPGPSGAAGSPGPAGQDGADGTNGKDGADGQDGTSIVTITCTSRRQSTFVFTFSDGSQQSVTCTTPPPESTPPPATTTPVS